MQQTLCNKKVWFLKMVTCITCIYLSIGCSKEYNGLGIANNNGANNINEDINTYNTQEASPAIPVQFQYFIISTGRAAALNQALTGIAPENQAAIFLNFLRNLRTELQNAEVRTADETTLMDYLIGPSEMSDLLQ